MVSGVALARLGGRVHRRRRHPAAGGQRLDQGGVRPLDEDQIEAYVESGEWRGKAGGYAVQGLAALFVRGLRGEYSNVVGLPLHLMYGLFSELGFDLVRRDLGERRDSECNRHGAGAVGIIPGPRRLAGRGGAASR